MWPHKKERQITYLTEFIIEIEGQTYHKHGEEYERLLVKIIAEQTKIIDRLTQKEVSSKPIFALTTFVNNQLYIMADVSLVIGGSKTGLFTLLDNKTLLPISPVTYSNQALGANSNPEFATFALDTTANTVTGTGVAAGSGTLVVTTHADYTDAGDGSAQSGDFSVTKNYTVVASADGSTFDVVFP